MKSFRVRGATKISLLVGGVWGEGRTAGRVEARAARLALRTSRAVGAEKSGHGSLSW